MSFLMVMIVFCSNKRCLMGRAQTFTEAIGKLLGTIHHHSTQADFDASGFDNRDDFYALRIEPYPFSPPKNTSACSPNKQMAEKLYHTKTALRMAMSARKILCSKQASLLF